MKSRILCILCLLCIGLSMNAQQTHSVHSFLLGDKIEKHHVAFKHFEALGKNAVWDMRGIELSDNTSLLEVVANPRDEQGLVVNENNTRYFYHHNEMGTYLDGYENNQSKICYNMPELFSQSNLVLNSKASGCFNGYAIYAESVYSRIYGTYENQVDGIGTLLLPSGDTIVGVTRVHVLKTTGQRYLKDVEDSKCLRLLVDSSCVYTPDSVLQHLAVDSNLVETNIYKWYAQGQRYPIYETIESHVKGNSVGFKTAYYCPLQSRQSLVGNDKEKTRAVSYHEKSSTSSLGNQGTSRHVYPDGTFIGYSVSMASDGHVNVSLFRSSEAQVECSIYTIDGMMICHQSFDAPDTKACRFSQSLSSHPHGVYILTISVGGQQFSEKFAYQ